MAPVRANMASRSVVLPLWKGPTSAMHRGPWGLLTSCPIAASLFGARPVIGSADWMLRPSRDFGKQENVAALHRERDRSASEELTPRPEFQAFQSDSNADANLALHAQGLQRDRIGGAADRWRCPAPRLLCPAVGTAIDELREEACDLSRPLEARQMGGASQHMARHVRHCRGHMTASFLNVREIEVTPDHKRWRRYLAETIEGG